MDTFSQKRTRIVLLFILGIGFLILLASGLSEVEFLPGQLFFLPMEKRSLPLRELSLQTWNLVNLWKIFSLVLLWILFPLSILYFIVSPEARKLVIRRAATMALTAYAFFLLVRQCSVVDPDDLLIGSGSATNLRAENALEGTISAQTESWFAWLANGLFVASLIFIIWRVMRWWSQRRTTVTALGVEASQALDDLQTGADLEDTILRCYAQMSRVVSEQRNIQRKQAMTPREFEQELTRCGLPKEDVSELTRLFELSRYGDIKLGEQEKMQALTCLQAIVEVCQEA